MWFVFKIILVNNCTKFIKVLVDTQFIGTFDFQSTWFNNSEIYYPPAVTAGRSETITFFGCGNAAGNSIPPYFVYPGKKMQSKLPTSIGCRKWDVCAGST
jgi:hypothetical protein